MQLRVKRAVRESGILMHISSLPSAYGIGSFGKTAYDFVDFLKKSRQKYWQILPLVPIGEGDSPYKSESCFAGEILFIDLNFLVADGLLFPQELPENGEYSKTDYKEAKKTKLPFIKLAASRFDTGRRDYAAFLKENSHWLDDYAVFAAAMDKTEGRTLSELSEALRFRNPARLEQFKKENAEEIKFHKVSQFLFFSQYFALKSYANENGIQIIGDIPFYVSLDSAEVWCSPESFRLGRDLTPISVAGVPPDIFSSSGQLWGNPIYDWEYQKKTDYLWWRKRLGFCAGLYDVIRIDHFRAFSSYYSIPFGAQDAKGGSWERGAGLYFWNTISKYLGKLNIIAEDLGGEEQQVQQLVIDCGFPNMKVLQFAFSSDMKNPFLPKNYPKNCVCYTGTHDNDTVLGWYSSASEAERLFACRIIPHGGGMPIPLRMIAAAMHSRAKLVIVPMQDWLCLGSESRMNTPGTNKNNWNWRLADNTLTDKLSSTVKCITGARNR